MLTCNIVTAAERAHAALEESAALASARWWDASHAFGHSTSGLNPTSD